MAARKARKRIEVGSGNVFADLGLPDAASRLGIGQPKVSALKNYKLDGLSVERLMAFLTALGQDVEIRIRARGRTKAQGRVFVQAA